MRPTPSCCCAFADQEVELVFHARPDTSPGGGQSFGRLANNVGSTDQVCRAAVASGVGQVVLISTDKAVRPTNVMGASKRLAELVVQAHAAEATSTRFSMVRFGNVLGSSGSVVPCSAARSQQVDQSPSPIRRSFAIS